MEKGAVTWVHSEGNYGFIGVLNSPVGIHFHQDFQVFPKINEKKELVFVPLNKKTKNTRRQFKVGDIILYEKEDKAKGPVATYWFFEDEYQKALRCQERQIYRLMKKTLTGAEEVWRGTSMDDFSNTILNKITKPSFFRLCPNPYWLERKKINETEWRKYNYLDNNKSII